MNRIILCLFLFLVIGCNSKKTHYQPVDWHSENPVENSVIENPVSEELSTINKLLKLHNKERELKGRQSFTLDIYLCEYAQKHSEWMSKANNLKHSKINVLLGKYYFVGENIAFNQQTEEEVVDAWMHSTGHRENIMNRNFTKIGFGISYDLQGQPYWCTVFGG